jgi:signal transduction histidine kinase
MYYLLNKKTLSDNLENSAAKAFSKYESLIYELENINKTNSTAALEEFYIILNKWGIELSHTGPLYGHENTYNKNFYAIPIGSSNYIHLLKPADLPAVFLVNIKNKFLDLIDNKTKIIGAKYDQEFKLLGQAVLQNNLSFYDIARKYLGLIKNLFDEFPTIGTSGRIQFKADFKAQIFEYDKATGLIRRIESTTNLQITGIKYVDFEKPTQDKSFSLNLIGLLKEDIPKNDLLTPIFDEEKRAVVICANRRHKKFKKQYQYDIRTKKFDQDLNNHFIWIKTHDFQEKELYIMLIGPKIINFKQHAQTIYRQLLHLQQITDEFTRYKYLSVEKLEDILHDFKGPLTALGGFAIRLHRKLLPYIDELNADSLKRVISIATGLEKILATTSESLTKNSDIFNENIPLTNVRFQEIDLFSKNFLAGLIEQHFQDYSIDISLKNDPLLAINSDYFERVLSELIYNAKKYGATKITLKIEIVEKLLKLSIIDNGIGIKKQDLKKIFDKSVRLQPEMAKGDGLGLARIKEIVEKHSLELNEDTKTIEVTSSILTGSTFTVYLPIFN